MAYPLLALLDLIALFLIELLLVGSLKITHDIPATMSPGSEAKVTVMVDKGSLTGFAKLQFDLPDGFTCTSIETKGASFTFSDQKAKFIWMSLPSTPTFKVSFNLVATPSAAGQLPITARFSYIEENERKTYELTPAMVSVLGEVVERTPEPAAPDASNDIVTAAGAVPVTTPVQEVAVEAPSAPVQQGPVVARRTVTQVSEQEVTVEVVIQKGDIRGFGKLQENIPQGFTALEKTSAQAIFTAQDRIVKLVWLNLPASPELKVTYKLRASGLPDGDHTVTGDFGYLVNDETRKADLGPTRFSIGTKAWQELAAQESNVDPMDLTDGKLPQKATPPPAAQQPVAQESKPARSTIPAPERGVTFKVQITAAHREVGREYFAQRHRFSGDFGIERHQGWIKYTTGSFNQYREARDKRVALVTAGHEFPGPFVTAYNNGERITVQEALAITNQNWVQ